MIIRLQHQRSDGDMDVYHLKSGRRYHIGRGSGCEVRILDLKLSRKHCAVEYSEGEWRVIDLCSTNGCKIDGDQIVGSQPLRTGTSIEIGQSQIRVVRILGDDEEDDGSGSEPVVATTPANRDRHSETNGHPSPHPVLEQEQLPPGDEVVANEHRANDWDPEPETDTNTKTGALLPVVRAKAKSERELDAARSAAQAVADQAHAGTGDFLRPPSAAAEPRAPAAKHISPLPGTLPPKTGDLESGPYKSLDPVEAVKPLTAPEPIAAPTPVKPPSESYKRANKVVPIIIQAMPVDDPPAPTPPAAAMASPTPAVDPVPAAAATEASTSAATPIPTGEGDERTFFITVLGRRVGPLNRAAARDLKTRELKGTLTLKDLDQYR
jgi:pSer/pThr/pTyr-binding forkhead associated (FHA) protein